MRATAPDYALPGTLVPTGSNWAIKLPNGKYLTVLHDGTDSSSDVILDQEIFVPPWDSQEDHWMVMVADRTIYEEHKAYFVSVIRVN